MLRFGLIPFRCAYGRDRNSSFLWFQNFRTCPWLPKPTIFIFGDARIPEIIQEKPKSFWRISICQISKFGKSIFKFWKRQAPNMPATRLRNSWKAWIWDQYLPENMKWKFGKSLILWTLKPRNQKRETNKPRNRDTKKPRNPSTIQVMFSCWSEIVALD